MKEIKSYLINYTEEIYNKLLELDFKPFVKMKRQDIICISFEDDIIFVYNKETFLEAKDDIWLNEESFINQAKIIMETIKFNKILSNANEW